MKKIFLVLVLTGLLIMPVTAGADFFNDGRSYMDSSLWQEVFNPDPVGVTSALTDVNNRLEWTAGPAWGTGAEAWRGYASGWQFDLSSDFDFTVDYHYAHVATSMYDHGGVDMSLYYFGVGPEPYSAGISAQHWFEDLSDYPHYSIESDFPIDSARQEVWSRLSTNGRLHASYNFATDTLTFEGLDYLGGVYSSSGSTSYTEISTVTDHLGLFLSGYSVGAELTSGDAYLGNLQINSGDIHTPVVPEPISSTLFIIGGATLGFRRFRKQFKK